MPIFTTCLEREHRLELFEASQIIYPRGDRRLGLGRSTFAAWARWGRGYTFGISTVLGGMGWVKKQMVCCGKERQKNLLSCWRCTILWGKISGTLVGKGRIVIPPLLEEGSAIINFLYVLYFSFLFSLFFTGLNSKRDGCQWCKERTSAKIMEWRGGEGYLSRGGKRRGRGRCGGLAGSVSGFSGSASAWSDRRVLILDCLVCCRPRLRIFSSERKDQKPASSTNIMSQDTACFACFPSIYRGIRTGGGDIPRRAWSLGAPVKFMDIYLFAVMAEWTEGRLVCLFRSEGDRRREGRGGHDRIYLVHVNVNVNSTRKSS